MKIKRRCDWRLPRVLAMLGMLCLCNCSMQKDQKERGRFVWTDTWLQRNGRWQIVAAEDLIATEKSD